MSKDLFADLLSAESGTLKKKTDSHLTLSERLNHSSQSLNNGTNNSAWSSNLDILDKISSSKQSNTSNGISKPDNDLEQMFDVFKQPPQQQRPATVPSIQSNSIDLLEDFFGSPSPRISSPTPPISQTPQQQSNDLFDGDDFSGNTPIEQPSLAAPSPAPQQQKYTETNKRDEVLAELVDMGFPIDTANDALDSTQSGCDLNGAISYLMNAAHSKTKPQRQDSPPQAPRRQASQHQDDIGSIVNDLSNEFRLKASFLFQSGRKKLQQGIEMYKQQQFERNNNQPLWMKNQTKYKANSIRLPGEEEDEEEMDPEAMRVLIERQREKDRQLKREKEREQKLQLQAREKERREQAEKQRQSSLFDGPAPRQRSETPKSSVSDEPISRRPESRSARSSASDVNDVKIAAPAVSKPADEALFHILNSAPVSRSSSNTPSQQSRLDKLRSSNVDDEPIYTSASRRRGNNSPRPASSPKPTISLPNIAISDQQLKDFNSNRAKASEFFKNGDFSKALEFYESSLNALPAQHYFKIIAYSNLSIVYSKLGNPKQQLENANEGLKLISSTISATISDLNNVIIEDEKSVKSFWVKLLSKKAEALEHLEKFQDSLTCYNSLIENGSSSKPIMEGKRRCNDMLQPKQKPKPKPKAAKPASKPRPTASQSASSTEAVNRVKEQNQKAESLENEKFQLHDSIESQLNQWKQGKEDNLRALLSSLHLILWPELQWKPVGLTDLVLDKKVKITYMKAVAKTHPDKISGESSTERKLIANGVFITLNQAWDRFKELNGIS